MEHLIYIPVVFFAGVILGVGLCAYWTKDMVDIPDSPDLNLPEEDIPLITPSLRKSEV